MSTKTESPASPGVSTAANPKAWVRLSRALVVGVAGFSTATLINAGCLNRPVGTDSPRTTNIVVDAIQQTTVNSVDLLFMVDNSVSMADKQEILRAAVPDLVNRLVNPNCVDNDGSFVGQAAGPDANCPPGSGREFAPLDSINVAVVTSSLADAGAGVNCTDGDEIDNAHLLGELRPSTTFTAAVQQLNAGSQEPAPNTQFLQWRGSNQDAFETALQELVAGSGQIGCGFEASLEAWYRFLIDPDPYMTLGRQDCVAGSGQGDCVVEVGTDTTILAQRAAFLRTGSLVAVVMLSDENDCSIRVGGQNWIVANTGNPSFAAATVCATNPNDPCCYSCGATNPPMGCTADASCRDGSGAPMRLDAVNDAANLRCFAQRQRFGVDFLYPTARYVNALTLPQLCTSRADLDATVGCQETATGGMRDNPLFRRTNPEFDRVDTIRSTDLVFLAGIVGVPSGLIRATGSPDGTPVGQGELQFLTAAQLSDPTLPGNQNPAIGWDNLVAGTDPNQVDVHMIEAIDPRPGLPGPNTADPEADPFNGHEWNIAPRNDLQYSCIFPLATPRTCMPNQTDCDCSEDTSGQLIATAQSPLCQQADGSFTNVQLRAKAFPPTRQLEVLRDFGARSIVASICADNVTDPDEADFGYRPAVNALIDRLSEALNNRCVPRALATEQVTEDGAAQPLATAPCSLVEVEPGGGANCDCAALGARRAPDQLIREAVQQRLLDVAGLCDTQAECNNACLCTLNQAGEDQNGMLADLGALQQCQYSETPNDSVAGWCYLDPAGGFGAPELVQQCPATQRRILRFVPDNLLRSGTTTFVACFGAAGDDEGIVQVFE